MFKQAITELNNTTSVRIFAPSGLWCDVKGKDLWIDSLINFKGDAILVYGEIPNGTEDALYKDRLDKLSKSKVKLVKIPVQEDVVSGFIIFDKCAICGYGNKFYTITNNCELNFLKHGFEGILQIKRIYGDA